MSKTSSQQGFIAIFLVLAAVLVVLAVTGGYFLFSGRLEQVPALKRTLTNGYASPKATTQDDLEAELDGIEIIDVDLEFSDVDKDINSL